MNRRKAIAIIMLMAGVLVIILLASLYDYITIYTYECAEKKKIHNIIVNEYIHDEQETYNHYATNDIDSRRTSNQNKNTEYPDGYSVSKNTDQNIRKPEWDVIIQIPDIDLEKFVYSDNKSTKHLEQYELITASPDMKYSNGGKYIICGHASRLYGHSLNRLKEINKGTMIYITQNDKTEQYSVKRIRYENMNHTSNFCNQTKEKTLTIISCAKYVSDNSYIVIEAKLE